MAVASPSRAVDQPSTRPPATCPATIAVRCSSGRRDFLIPQSSLVGYIGLQHVKSDVDDHVFLSADHLAAAELDKDRTGIEAIILRRPFRMAKEGGMDTSITERQRLTVDAYRPVLRSEEHTSELPSLM